MDGGEAETEVSRSVNENVCRVAGEWLGESYELCALSSGEISVHLFTTALP